MSNDLFSLLITQTWQVTLLFAAVWVAVKLFAKERPHLAHALWLLVLIKCLTPPVFSSPTSPFSWLKSHESAVAENTAVEVSGLNVTGPTENFALDSDLDSADTIVVRAIPEQSTATLSNPFRSAGPNSIQQPAQRFSKPFDWAAAISWLWIAGAIVGLFVTVTRFGLFVRWTRRCRIVEIPELAATVQRLSRRLGLRRRVHVRVLEKPVGPAVTGLIRPTILLPASIVEGKTLDDLEPLLAHELIHIRRGDLWWALVQTVTRCLFWFHPLVQLATRMLTRESERSCDEETVASMGCSPAVYAKGLLDVLEHKHRLRVAPALPGVRPVDITSARLERVMKLGNGIHSKTPLWTWMVLAVCCATVLPGAALVFGQEQVPEKQETSQGTDPSAVVIRNSKIPVLGDLPYIGRLFKNVGVEPLASLPLAPLVIQDSPVEPAISVDDSSWTICLLPLGDLEEKWKQSKGYDSTGLEISLGCYVPGSNGRDPIPDNQSASISTNQGVVEFGNRMPTMRIVNGTLYAFGPTKRHQELAASIKRGHEFGFQIVTVQARMLTVPEDKLESLGISWSLAPVATEGVIRPASHIGVVNDTEQLADSINAVRDGDLIQAANAQGITATSFVQRNTPVVYGLIDIKKFRQVVATTKGTSDMNLLQAPTVTMCNGQNASVYSGAKRPFVIGFDRVTDEATGTVKLQPVVQVVNDGQQLKFNARIMANEAVKLDCRMVTSRILKVDEIELPIKGNRNKTVIQVPQIATTRVQASLEVPAGKTLVLGSMQQNPDGKNEMSVVFLTCYLPFSDNPELRQSKTTQPDFNVQPAQSMEEATELEEQAFCNPDGTISIHLVPASTVRNVESAKVDFLIQSEEKSESGIDSYTIEDKKSPLYGARIEGRVSLETENETTIIRGNQLNIKMGDDTAFRADEGELRCSGEDVIIHLKGSVVADFEGELKLVTDELVYGEGGNGPVGLLNGSARIDAYGVEQPWKCNGDVIRIDKGHLIIEGKGTFQREGENPRRVSADLIKVDITTLKIATPDSIPGEQAAAGEGIFYPPPINR